MTTALTTTKDNTLDTFFDAIAAKELAPRTQREYQKAIERAVAAGVDVRDATQLQRYASTLPSSSRAFLRSAVRAWADYASMVARSQATPNNVQSVQAAVYRLDALRDAVKLDTPKGEKLHIWLTKKETRQLMALPDTSTTIGRRDRVLLALLVGAGLRRREAVRLRWAHVVKQGERVSLDVRHGKGNKARVVPVSATLARFLDDWREETVSAAAAADAWGDDTAPADSDFVLRSVDKGGRLGDSMTGTAAYLVVRKYGAQLGKPALAPHDLRRTYAQHGVDAGVAIQQVSTLLGHSSVAVTQKYLNLAVDFDTTVSDFVPLE